MRVLSGIQPTGELHIGNYLGAVKQWAELQKKEECIFFIADLHALTTPHTPENFQKIIFEKVIDLLAAGLDPEHCIIFIQSQIKEHTELAWLLNTITPISELERMIQYKEKSRKFKQNIHPVKCHFVAISPKAKLFNGVNAGLLSYPVLQAADILLYQTDAVPVGKDQAQHVELTRTIAKKFNQKFGETFRAPKALILEAGGKIMSLQDPKNKMSKTDKTQSYIGIFDTPESIQKKIMAAVTDTGKAIKYDPLKKPGMSNLLTIFSLFGDKSIKETEKKFKGKGYAEFKKQLANLLILKLEPFRRKKKELLSREVYVREILERSRKRAQVIAQSTMQDVRKKMGLI